MKSNADTASELSTAGMSNPSSLLRLMVLVAGISIAAIVTLTFLGIHRVNSREVIADAEYHAVQVSEAIVAVESQALLEPGSDGREVLSLDEGSRASLNNRLTKYLKPFSILKIKMYSPDALIVYSTDPSVIGKADVNNEELQVALNGAVDSELESGEKVLDLLAETRFEVDVVETYVPIKNTRGDVVGSFEIYTDVTGAKPAIMSAAVTSTLILLGILLAVFGLAFMVVRRGARELRGAQDRLEIMARVDALTGVPNRREILARATRECNRMRRRDDRSLNACLGFAMIDIDEFKKVNDTHGHSVGDEVLCEVARRLEGSVRQYDAVGRYGGEEFLAIMPETSLENASIVAERMRVSVEATPIHTDAGDISVTVSLGVSTAANAVIMLDKALVLADAALYQAKHEGRNRVRTSRSVVHA